MKRIILLLLWGVLFTAEATAQVSGFNQRGRATQEMTADWLAIAHPTLPLNAIATVANAATGKQVDTTVSGRIQPSDARIADLSEAVWQALELDADSEIIISVALPAWEHSVQPVVTNVVVSPPLNKAVEIIPGLPNPASDKIYRLQVGAYSTLEDAASATRLLNGTGFSAITEQNDRLYWVIATEVPSTIVLFAVQRLTVLGFRQIWVKE